MAFDSTIGGADANSYVSVAEADSYFEFRPDGSVWLGLNTEDKEVYLVRATDKLEQQRWGGKPTDQTQALQFPRDYIRNRYYDYLEQGSDLGLTFDSSDEYYYPNDEIPTDIVKVVCDLAIHYYRIEQEQYDLTEHQYETYNKLNVGGVQLELRDGLTADRLPTNVKRTLRTFSTNGWLNGQAPRLVRG